MYMADILQRHESKTLESKRDLCAAAGLPPPAFEERGFRFRVTVSLRPRQARVLDSLAGRILELLTAENSQQGLSTQQIAQGLQLTPRAVRARLARLVEQGSVVVVGTNDRDPRRKYFWRT